MPEQPAKNPSSSSLFVGKNDPNNNSSTQAHGELHDLLERSITLSEQILEEQEHIKKRLLLMSIGNYVRLFILLIPIILGIIYLPPIIERAIEQYTNLFGGASRTSTWQYIQELLPDRQ